MTRLSRGVQLRRDRQRVRFERDPVHLKPQGGIGCAVRFGGSAGIIGSWQSVVRQAWRGGA
jgi:hypothetical protein